jgi:hypothetical protein
MKLQQTPSLQVFDVVGGKWEEVESAGTGSVPMHRDHHAAAFYRGKMIIYGACHPCTPSFLSVHRCGYAGCVIVGCLASGCCCCRARSTALNRLACEVQVDELGSYRESPNRWKVYGCSLLRIGSGSCYPSLAYTHIHATCIPTCSTGRVTTDVSSFIILELLLHSMRSCSMSLRHYCLVLLPLMQNPACWCLAGRQCNCAS